MAYAVDTKVPVEKTQGEIRALVNKNGAENFALMEERDRVHIAFLMNDRRIRFSIPMPVRKDNYATAAERNRRDKLVRSKWRALLLVIKSKIEAVESGIETFEEAFLAHVQMPSGQTVYEELKAPLALRYRENSNQPLLPAPK